MTLGIFVRIQIKIRISMMSVGRITNDWGMLVSGVLIIFLTLFSASGHIFDQ